MSLILEALKKSEAERRLGQAPDLLTPTPRLRPDDHPRWPLRAAVAVLVLGLGAAGAWWFWPRAEAPPAVARAGSSAGDAAAKPEPTTAAREAAPPRPDATTSPGPVAGPGAPAPTRPAATVPPRAPAPAPDAPPAPADPAFASVERESQAVPAGELPPGMTASGGEAPSVRPQPPRSLPQPTARAAADADAGVAMPPRAPAARDAATPRQQPEADALPALRDLSPAEREALPPLQQSMHVYNDDPARRFVIIDGRRLGEGERIDERLLLVEIRRDGVVLELDGRRFLLPRPG